MREMKDSGIAWIGEIPREWEVCRLKDVGFLYGGLTGKAGDDFNVEDEDSYALFIPFTNIFNNDFIDINNLHKVKVNEGENQNEVNQGDLLFLMSSEDVDGIGKPSLLRYSVKQLYLNSFCKGLRITSEKVEPEFLFYLLSSQMMREQVRMEAKGFIRINLRQDKLAGCSIMLPPLSEQHLISSYLDAKCSEIDRALSLQEQMISELRAYKQSLITETVTHGLNPNAKMKNSGVEWIGDVPEGWEVCKLKYAFKLLNGRAYSDTELLEEGKYRILRVGNLFTSDKWYYSDMELDENKYCDKNDLLYGWSASIGPYIWKGEKVIYHYHIWKVLFEPNNIRYSFYILQALTDAKRKDMHGSAMQHLTKDNMDNSQIPVPPLSEQRSIASFLDEKCAEIDALIVLREKKMEALKEYKKSLIYECVTGKKEIV